MHRDAFSFVFGQPKLTAFCGWHPTFSYPRLRLDNIPLDVVESPYREIGRPLLDYLHHFDDGSIPAMVVIPEFVVSKWWHHLLHNATSMTIRDVLYHDHLARGHGRPVIIVPYRIGDEPYEPEVVGHVTSLE